MTLAYFIKKEPVVRQEIDRETSSTTEVSIAGDGAGAAQKQRKKVDQRNPSFTQGSGKPNLGHRQIVSAQDSKNMVTVKEIETDPNRRLELTINESLVRELERQWADLPHQVRLQSEERGWRVTYIDERSRFAATGLQTGDFIPAEAIQSLRAQGDAADLPERVIRILNHVR